MLLRIALIAALLTILAAPAAEAHSLTVADSLAIADRWAAKDAPRHVNHCADGNLSLALDPTVPTGAADGWALDGQSWRWDYTACRARLNPSHAVAMQHARPLDPGDLLTPGGCWSAAHELLHFVVGPDHLGPLDPAHPGAMECFEERPAPAVAAVAAHEAAHAQPVRRRSRAQIARSMRYQRIRARISARRYNSRARSASRSAMARSR